MAIIYTYGFDNNVQGNDAWIGTNADNRKTKQFTVSSVANYLNTAGVIAIGGQLTFKFVTSGATNGTISLPGGGGGGTNFTDIASLYVSVTDTSGANVVEWLDYLVGQELLLSEQNEPNNFGHYRITSYTVAANPNFYTLVLTDIGGYGVITQDTYYNLNNVNLVSGNTDPTGLEAINEGNGIGWRLIGRDADNYGNIGVNGVDFSYSTSVSTTKGSTGVGSVTFGLNNSNPLKYSIVSGDTHTINITGDLYADGDGNIIAGENNTIYNNNWNNIVTGFLNTVGTDGAVLTNSEPVVYDTIVQGTRNEVYGARDGIVVGRGLLTGSRNVAVFGMCNEDLTTSTSNWAEASINNYGPRLVVGVGTWSGGSSSGSPATRANGFVVMSDGTSSFPSLTNDMIDASGDDSAVTKGWVTTATANAESDLVFYTVKNSSGTQILKGKAVMAVGTDGNSGHILIDEFVADGSIEPKYFMGVLEDTLDNGEIGRVLHFGELRQFNTLGQNGETWNDGDILWCDPANPGDFTLIEPLGPNVKIAAAIVINAATNGKIKVRVQGNEGIKDLYDTRITPQTDGDVLVWNDTDGVWFNDSTLNVDYTNSRVGIGTTSPGTKLHIGTGSGATVDTGYQAVIDSAGIAGLQILSATNQSGRIVFGDSDDNDVGMIKYDHTDNSMGFRTNGSGNERMRINSSGNVGIGTTSPLQKLHLNDGTNVNLQIGAVSGELQIKTTNDADTAYTPMVLRASEYNILTGNVGIGTNSPGAKLDIRANAQTDIALSAGYGSQPNLIVGTNTGYTRLEIASGSWHHKFFTRTSSGASSERFTIEGGADTGRTYFLNSNVGIGTTSPSTKLHVIGDTIIEDTSAVLTLKSTQVGTTSSIQFESLSNASIWGGGSADYLSFMTASNHRMRILANGNVGIGTTTPAQKLHVAGNGRFTGSYLDVGHGVSTEETALSIGNFRTDNGYAYIDLIGDTTYTDYALRIIRGNSGPNAISQINHRGTGDFEIRTADAANITFDTASLERLRITSAGNVGIGTTAPQEKLDISAGGIRLDDNQRISWASTDANIGRVRITGNEPNDFIAFVTDNSERMRLTNTGLGIGTTSPSQKLEVSEGYILASGSGTSHGFELQRTGLDTYQLRHLDGGLTVFNSTDSRKEMTFDGSGNVGIGTSSPSEKLDVDGNVKLGATTGRQLMFGENKYGAVRLGNNLVVGGNQAVDIRTGNAALSSQSSRVFINQTGFVGVGTTTPQVLLDVNGPIKIGDAVTSPLANTVGTMRYRADSNNSYAEMVMQTGASTYAWVVIKQNTW
jgi:hypothetical protein